MVFDKILKAFKSDSASGTTFEMIAVIVLTVLIAYVVGLMISHIVDRKLGDIEIQMPKINVNSPQHLQQQTPPQIVFRISENAQGKINLQPLNPSSPSSPSSSTTEHFTNARATRHTQHTLPSKGARMSKRNRNNKHNKHTNKIITQHPNRIQTSEPFLSVSFQDPKIDDINDVRVQTSRTQSNDIPYKDYTKTFVVDTLDYPIVVETTPPPTEVKPRIGCTTDTDCNGVFGNGKNVCKSDGTCHCLSGSGTFCHLGPTNFRDPKDMTPTERKRFKLKFRNNMSLQDYKNWLMLYKDEIENLRQHHRRNLLKLLKGGQMTVRDLPSVRIRGGTNAADFFKEMYRGGKISVSLPDDSPLVGSNYNDYGDFVNPENDSSNAITNIVDLYKETKDDARALNYHLRPDSTIGIEEENVGDIYQKYLKNTHNYADLRKIAKVIDENERSQIPQRQNKTLLTFESKDLNIDVE